MLISMPATTAARVASFSSGAARQTPTNFKHWREGPGNAGGSCFSGRDFCEALHQRGIPCRGHPNLLRMKRGTLYIICAVNGVDAVENGNLQTSLLRCFLNLPDDLAPLINRQGLTVYVKDR